MVAGPKALPPGASDCSGGDIIGRRRAARAQLDRTGSSLSGLASPFSSSSPVPAHVPIHERDNHRPDEHLLARPSTRRPPCSGHRSPSALSMRGPCPGSRPSRRALLSRLSHTSELQPERSLQRQLLLHRPNPPDVGAPSAVTPSMSLAPPSSALVYSPAPYSCTMHSPTTNAYVTCSLIETRLGLSLCCSTLTVFPYRRALCTPTVVVPRICPFYHGF